MHSDTSSLLFAKKSVGKLLVRFALPAILAQIANSVYLIVDQVLLANSHVGTVGYGATSVAFPILTAANALAFLFGGGGAAFASLRLGQGDQASGKRALWYSQLALLSFGLLLTILGFVFLRPILLFFGATEELLPYATAYSRILLLGLPVIALGSSLSYWVRADGSPGFSMAMMLAGAVFNVALDWLFLFPLKWGIAGLAWAMVLSRGISVIFGIWYLLKRGKHFSLSFGRSFGRQGGQEGNCTRTIAASPDAAATSVASGAVAEFAGGAGKQILGSVLALGSSGFFMQCAIIVVQIVTNRSLRSAATQALLDPAVIIGAMGVVTKVNGILIAIVTGLATGAQPILGFHQGAGHKAEVRKTYWFSVLWATVAAFACWGITVFGSEWVAGVFAGSSGGGGVGAGDFVSTAAWFMHVYLLAIFTAGFQLISGYYFQATGRPWKACLLTLSRQLFLLVPLILVLPHFFGLSGILYAGPIADVGAAGIAGVFMWKEMRGDGSRWCKSQRTR